VNVIADIITSRCVSPPPIWHLGKQFSWHLSLQANGASLVITNALIKPLGLLSLGLITLCQMLSAFSPGQRPECKS
jgi:hypothetical protein